MAKNYTDINAEVLNSASPCPVCGNDDCDTLLWQDVMLGAKLESFADAVAVTSKPDAQVHCMKCGTIYEVNTGKVIKTN